MLTKPRASGLLWPTVFAIPALALLLGLGNWQMERKAWKDGLQAAINGNSNFEHTLGAMEKLRLEDVPSLLAMNTRNWNYLRFQFRGRFMHDQERHLYAPDPKLGPGYHVYTPLRLRFGGLVLVNRGYVPEALKDPAKRAEGQIGGLVVVTGLLRTPVQKGYFTPVNDAKRNMWFWRDIAAMLGCRDGEPGTACATVAERQQREIEIAPFTVDALAEPANPGGWPRGGTTNLNLPNRHLEYALTWYGLAATLVGVFAAFAWGRLRKPVSAATDITG